MGIKELKALLDEVPDTRELVLRAGSGERQAAFEAWRDAREDADAALGRWRDGRRSTLFHQYRAAQDREDAAQDALAAAPRR